MDAPSHLRFAYHSNFVPQRDSHPHVPVAGPREARIKWAHLLEDRAPDHCGRCTDDVRFRYCLCKEGTARGDCIFLDCLVPVTTNHLPRGVNTLDVRMDHAD